jgi:hypothetical protein
MSPRPDLGASNKQVLADTFRNLVRYALLKTRRDANLLGVTVSNFTVAAVGESLAASSNTAISGEQEIPTVTMLIKKSHRHPLIFHFYWRIAKDRSLQAAFDFSYQDGDLKVRLLWLGLPELVPISPHIGVIDGCKPLEEAVAELLIVKNGRLSAYAPPA